MKFKAITPTKQLPKFLKSIRPKAENVFGQQLSKLILKPFEDYVSNFSIDISFDFGIEKSKDQIRIVVFPSGRDKEIITYLDDGVPEHPISGNLVFPGGGYRAKTVPNSLSVGSTGIREGPLIFTKSVNHPGIEARNISKQIKKVTEKKIKDLIKEVFIGD